MPFCSSSHTYVIQLIKSACVQHFHVPYTIKQVLPPMCSVYYTAKSEAYPNFSLALFFCRMKWAPFSLSKVVWVGAYGMVWTKRGGDEEREREMEDGCTGTKWPSSTRLGDDEGISPSLDDEILSSSPSSSFLLGGHVALPALAQVSLSAGTGLRKGYRPNLGPFGLVPVGSFSGAKPLQGPYVWTFYTSHRVFFIHLSSLTLYSLSSLPV